MSHSPEDYVAPLVSRLGDYTNALRRGEIGLLRITPLVLKQPLHSLLTRRRWLFSHLDLREEPFGLSVSFVRDIRPSASHPEGRQASGEFDILLASDELCLLVSSLESDLDNNGPKLLCERAYPVAKRPFIKSDALVMLIEKLAAQNDWVAVSRDAMGYDRETREFRRDLKCEPVIDATAEMNEQGRDIHRIEVSFRNEEEFEELRVAFDRYSSATVYHGSVEKVATGFVLPAIQRVRDDSVVYDISRTVVPTEQEKVDLVFSNEPFKDYESMRTLCGSVRKGDGLSVTTIHLNPYLQAQVLDFFTGAAIDLLVMDDRTVSLIPRSENCSATLERVSSTIFQFFSEGQATKENVWAR